jgi:hypothetical protein
MTPTAFRRRGRRCLPVALAALPLLACAAFAEPAYEALERRIIGVAE